MFGIRDNINRQLDSSGLTNDCFISPLDVSTAVSMLKRSKSDVNNLFSSDHFIFACHDLYVHISFLFTSLVIHNVVPNTFLLSSIRPIPKGHNQSLADSSNYRGIAIGSIYCKLFDNIVLSRYRSLLVSNDLQFGFKRKHCTQMCTMVLKEAISYYINNRNAVFCTFLDATKAFDRVQYCKLFNVLIARKLPSCSIRMLNNFYVDNCVHVTWLNVDSDSFIASNGVKQGGILSPILFCVYIDQLLVRLSHAGDGCVMGDMFVGCLAYADDIVLVAPTPSAMRKMLLICDEFATEFSISFNASKSKCVVINARCRSIPGDGYIHTYNIDDNILFKINNCDIEIVSSYKHLGHVINSRFNDDDDLFDKRASFIGQANNVICYFNKLRSNVKYRLFESYCTSYFGCELWRLDHPVMQQFSTAWRRAIRRVWSLPFTTHSNLLPIVCNGLHFHDDIYRRFVNFVIHCLNHDSTLIRNIVSYGILFNPCISCVGYNVSLCLSKFHFLLTDLFNSNISSDLFKECYINNCDQTTVRSASLLKELIGLRDGMLSFSVHGFLSLIEINCLIDHVATL